MILSEKWAFLIVLSAAILWGTTGTAQTFIPTTVDPFFVSMLRLAIGGIILLMVLGLMRKLKFADWPWKKTLLTAAFLAVFQYCFFSSVRLTGVAIGTVLSIGSAPVFAGLFESFVLKKPPSRKWMMATVLTIAGCAILFFNKELVVFSPLGAMFAIAAGLLFALYTLNNKRIVEENGALKTVAVVFTISAMMLLPFMFFFESNGILTKTGIFSILYIGVVTTAIGYVLYSVGLKNVTSSSATTIALAEPLTAAILSVVVVGEYLNASGWFGVFMILIGLVILSMKQKHKQAAYELQK
ncbi:MAG: EamA family transporter [Bacilli bacterium]|mgnify:FL=1|nr:EamA family transporter [Bacilli bacterium]